MQPGSGALVRVRVEDEHGLPLPGVTVELERMGEKARAYVTGVDGNADAWVPAGRWTIRTRMTNFRRGEGEMAVMPDGLCRMTFRVPLDGVID